MTERSLTWDRILAWRLRRHLLDPIGPVGALLSLVGAVRSWEQPSWQRNFGAGPEEIALLAATVTEVLDGRVLERDPPCRHPGPL